MWAQEVVNGQPVGSPRLLQAEPVDQAVAWHDPDRFYAVMYNFATKLYAISAGPANGEATNAASPLPVRLEGLVDTYSRSPNLDQIALTTPDGQLHVCSPVSRTLKTFPIASSSGDRPSNIRWSADGREVFVVAYGGKHGTNIKVVDVNSEEAHNVSVLEGFRGVQVMQWSGDGRQIGIQVTQSNFELCVIENLLGESSGKP